MPPLHWNTSTGLVKLIDFGISQVLGRTRISASPLLNLAGTAAYISPEQTGRMNRDLDSRSDLYSLGVTLYELVTGRLPFQSQDPLEFGPFSYCSSAPGSVGVRGIAEPALGARDGIAGETR